MGRVLYVYQFIWEILFLHARHSDLKVLSGTLPRVCVLPSTGENPAGPNCHTHENSVFQFKVTGPEWESQRLAHPGLRVMVESSHIRNGLDFVLAFSKHTSHQISTGAISCVHASTSAMSQQLANAYWYSYAPFIPWLRMGRW